MRITLDTELLRARTLELLAQVGLKVEHEELAGIMLERGCSRSATGRILIPPELIADLVAYQESTRAEDDDDQELVPWCGPDWAHWIIWTGRKQQMRERMSREFLMQAFDCGPTQYYDYRSAGRGPVNTEVLVEMMKLAEATPEIGYTSTWYRQDVPQPTERIASLVLALQYTSKVDGIESMNAGAIKYLLDIGEIMGYRREDAPYLAGSQCLVSPLTLDEWVGADMLERARQGVYRYHAASMPTIGVSSPVTVAGTIVVGAAEILGGMAAGFCLAPEGDITGRMISTVGDMRTADAASAGPENVMVTLGVKRLFNDHFGGHLWAETYFSPSCAHPGLQAVCQNWLAGTAFARLAGHPEWPYPGMGTLDNGGLGSPTQLMLDMEIRKSQFALREQVEVSEDTVAFDTIREVVESAGSFLSSEHTLEHFRELWSSELFPLSPPAATAEVGDEKRILELCEERWRANVARWEPPELADETLRALEDVLARANEELL
ncbi:MAG: trimethylamine methyltransferase family protein [Armatimonadota bacterium]